MLIVLPDSNRLYGRLLGTRPGDDWTALLRLSAQARIQLGLSELVRWELANQAKRELAKQVKRQGSITAKLRRYGLDLPEFIEGEGRAEELVAAASEALRNEILSNNGRLCPIPEVSHAELVRRSLDRRRPFDESDRGYRDALIWHTALGLIREGHSVILVSNDREAFAERGEEARLHPQLEAELRRLGWHGRLRLATELGQAVEMALALSSAEIAEVNRALADDEIAAEITMELCRRADGEILDGSELGRWGWADELVGVRINEVEDFGALSVRNVARDGAQITARVCLDVVAALDVRSNHEVGLSTFEALASPGPIRDVGVGLLDGLVQTNVDRELTLVGELNLNVGAWHPMTVQLVGIEMPRESMNENQLSFGFPFEDLIE